MSLMETRARSAAGIAIVGCLILALAAAPAVAKKHKKKRKLGPVVTVTATGNTAAADGQESAATATCPAGKQAVGGGFTAPVTPGSALLLHSSYRSAPNAWSSAGQVAQGVGAVTAYAYCRNSSAGTVTDVTASASFTTDGEIKTLSPACPAGTRLVGGGFQSAPPSGSSVVFPEVNQATTPSTWTVTGVENNDGSNTLTAHAYCMAKIAAPAFVTATGSGSGGLFAGATATTPKCPAPKKPKKGKKRKKRPRKLLSAGGFASSPIASGLSNSPVPVIGESRISGTGWLASVINGSQTGSFSVTSQGVCF